MRNCLAAIGLSFVALFLFCGLAAMLAPDPAAPANAPAEATARVDEPSPAGGSPRLTLATFNQCRTGMTYDEVVEIIGPPESVMSENEIGDLRTAMYMWKGGFVANANMTFQNGKLVSKAQFGL